MFPKTGHVVNLEEPDLFNQVVGDFLARVDAGRWPPRDPRSIAPAPIPPAWNRSWPTYLRQAKSERRSRRC